MKRVFLITALLVGCAASSALAQRAAPAATANPFANNADAPQQGAALYAQNCTQCHGPNGALGKVGSALVSGESPDPPHNDVQLFDMIKNGVSGTLMPAFSGKLSDDETWKLVSYIRSLRGMAINNPAPGNAAHGEQVFFGKGQCGTCHMAEGKGGVLGPNLNNIASTRKTISIIDALTKPQHHVYGLGGAIPQTNMPMDSFTHVRVTTQGGQVINGVLMNQDNFSLQVMGDDQKLHLLDRAKLRSVEMPAESVMPTDYDKRLTPEEFQDLLAFLTRQGKAGAAAPARPVGD